ncbi:uncharacterized protein LOC123004314 [Tribolium madens]|uniref:uncharacterized protein LOC123004314 n=1 Tax=Tribolium madens TaxID=41895 RepID=UPI001CF72A7D|nr:uncharacterized protein LOC123004314 [Tribolium madens]
MSEQRSNNDMSGTVLICKVVIIAVFVYPLLHYTFFNKSEETPGTNQSEIAFNQTEEPETAHKVKKIARIVLEQPSCPISYLQVVLQDLCRELFLLHEQCTPEDVDNLEKHKLPKISARNNTTSEPRGTIVGCVAAGLLLTSLGAAFLELYKAKSQTPVKNTKPTMSRKCSLADLTVLKHNRKELVRRESIMELPENGGHLKQLGFRPPPLYRRCSFPVGPSELSCGNSYATYQESRRCSIESRRLSIIDSRRNSVDCRKASIDGRRISIDNESPERRHWSRLVHRH